MKTSKIKRIESTKEWGEGDRKIIYHNVEMENGDKLNIGKKKLQEVGWELTYTIEGEGQEYNKAKSAQKQETNQDLKGIKIGHALNCSCTLFSGAGDSVTDEQIEALALRIYRLSDKLNNQL